MRDLRERQRTGNIRRAPDRRLPGVYRAIVTDNNDPAQLGRLKVKIPEVSGVDAALPEWAWPINSVMSGGTLGGVNYGSLFLPPVGAAVHVEFVGGDPDVPAWLPGWQQNNTLPSLLATNYPKRQGLVTPSGHALYFDDSDGDAGEVVLRDRDGALVRIKGTSVYIGEGADQHLVQGEKLIQWIVTQLIKVRSHIHPYTLGFTGTSAEVTAIPDPTASDFLSNDHKVK